MHFSQLRWRARMVVTAALMATFAVAPSVSRADSKSELGMQILNFLGIGVGGYWFTSDSAVDALGTPKFVGHTTFFGKPAHRGGYRIAGGYHEISIKDHWQPYSGGNKVSFQGVAFKITPEKKTRYDLLPFVHGGIYYGEIDSDKMNFKANRIVPSIAIGVEKEIVRYVRLSAAYRFTERFGGVDTSGGFVSLTLFP
jgi:hypothetical protein